MFIYLSKLLPLLVYPAGLVTLLILIALLTTRRPRMQRVALSLALGVLLVGGNRWVADGLLRSLEWRYIPQEDIPKAEVIVLLGGGTQPADFPRPTVEFSGAGDRVFYTAHLYHQGKAERILVSGGGIEWLTAPANPALDMASLLQTLQVPEEAIWLETTSRNTYENAANSWNFLEPLGIRRIILVTSAAHMPRAVALFERQGFEVIPAPTDYRVTQAGWDAMKRASFPVQLIYLFPSADNLVQTTNALKEYFGLLIYRLRGWL